MKKNALIAALFCLFFTSSVLLGQSERAITNANPTKLYKILSVDKPESSNKSVNFTYDVNGVRMTYDALTKGKVVFLNFWATWCGPCKREIPDIIELYKNYNGDDFIVIGISTDRGSNSHDKVEKFIDSKGIPYINLMVSNELSQAYGGISSIPRTFIIDKEGNIKEKIVGMRTYADFEASVKRFLGK